ERLFQQRPAPGASAGSSGLAHTCEPAAADFPWRIVDPGVDGTGGFDLPPAAAFDAHAHRPFPVGRALPGGTDPAVPVERRGGWDHARGDGVGVVPGRADVRLVLRDHRLTPARDAMAVDCFHDDR